MKDLGSVNWKLNGLKRLLRSSLLIFTFLQNRPKKQDSMYKQFHNKFQHYHTATSIEIRPLHLCTLKYLIKRFKVVHIPRHFHSFSKAKAMLNYSKFLKKNRKTIFGTDFHIIQPKPDNWIKVVKKRGIEKNVEKDRANVYTKSH